MNQKEIHAQQMAAHDKCIGGSDVSGILGLNKWKTPYDVFISKTQPVDHDAASEAAYWGSTLEEIIAKEFQKRTGLKIQRVNKTIRIGEGGWQGANIDRAIVNTDIAGTVRFKDDRLTTDAILEVKTCNAFAAHEWGPSQLDEIKTGKVVTAHGIPLAYECQIQWYMGITKTATCYVAVLIGGQDFRVYKVPFNEMIYKDIQRICQAFWQNNVLAKVAPEPANAEEVLKQFPISNGDTAEADNKVSSIISSYRNLAGQIKQLTEEKDDLQSQIIAAIGEKDGLTIAGNLACTYRTTFTNRFDTAGFKKAHPDLYSKYTKQSSSRRFLMK